MFSTRPEEDFVMSMNDLCVCTGFLYFDSSLKFCASDFSFGQCWLFRYDPGPGGNRPESENETVESVDIFANIPPLDISSICASWFVSDVVFE